MWNIIRNIGSVISFFKVLKSFFGEVIEKKNVPECKSTAILLENLEGLLRKKIIDIPGVEEIEIANAIAQVREQLQCNIK